MLIDAEDCSKQSIDSRTRADLASILHERRVKSKK